MEARILRGPQPRGREKLARLIEWLHWVIAEAELYDVRYPVKGAYVWRPYGMKIRRNVEAAMRRLLEETGHGEVLFPVFIPYEFFAKESEHIRGFEEEVFWVTKGLQEGESRLVLRPTSETAIMPMFKLWIRDHTDLPYKVYQIVSVFRAETKMTHPLIRLREISMFKEAHTAHVDREDAERQVREAVDIYRRFFDELAVPYLISRRPDWDKFAGAVYTIAFDTVLPDGRALQIGTVHYLGTNFSRVFEVTYLTPDGRHELVHTTSYGISERSIAAMLAVHGDDRGLVLPPSVSPYKLVIVPIFYSDEEYAAMVQASRGLASELQAAGISAIIDERRDKTPGWKYHYWELLGVPLRVEIGRRDVEEGRVVIARRDTLEKVSVPRGSVVDHVRSLLSEVQENLRREAWQRLSASIKRVETLEDARVVVGEERAVAEVPWNGRDECGVKLQDAVDANALGVPLDRDPDVGGYDLRDPICGDRATYWLRIARRY